MVLDAAKANSQKSPQDENRPVEEATPDPAARQALEELCKIYWYPLYAFARRQGETPDAAMDATQAFFADLLEKSWIDRADPAQGRFRSFLVTVFRRFLSDQRKRAAAIKRGGGVKTFSIDAASAEERYQMEPADTGNPSDAFERRWALALLDRVYVRLAEENAEKGREDQFKILKKYLTSADAPSYAEAARQLEISEGNVKVSVHRLRQRFRELLTEEVAQTVESAADVPSEMNSLLDALCRTG